MSRILQPSRSVAAPEPQARDYIQEVLTRVLTLRPKDPIAYMAEYFRTAAALELYPPFSNGHLVYPTLPTPTSTPVSRACFLLTSTDERQRPAAFDAQVSAAFDELTAGSAAAAASDSNLLGSLLLPRPAQARSSPFSSLRPGIAAAGKKPDGSSASSQELGVDSGEWKGLIQRLLEDATEKNMHVDLSSTIVAALVDEAAAASQPFSADAVAATPRRPDAVSRLITFPTFSAGVRDCLRSTSLHTQLRSLVHQLRSSEDADSLPAGEVIELLRILSQQQAASRSSSISLDQMCTILSDLELEPKSFHPSKPISTEDFLHAVVSSHLQLLLLHRRTVRAAARERSRIFLERQQRDSTEATGGGGLDPATAAIYAAAFHNNPARTAALTPFEDPETVEYS